MAENQNGKSLVKQQAETMRNYIEAKSKDLEEVIVKSLGGVQRLLALTYTAMNANPDLLKCTPASVFIGIMNCATLGLEPNTVKQEAFLIPYQVWKNGKPTGIWKANFQMGSRGWTTLVRRSDSPVCHISPTVVYEGDIFEEERGSNPGVRHIPKYESTVIVKAYAVAFRRGESGKLIYDDHETVTADMIKAARNQNQAVKKNSPSLMHDKFPEEAAKKFVGMRMSKRLDIDAPMAAAIALDGAAEAGKAQGIFNAELGGIDLAPEDLVEIEDKSDGKSSKEIVKDAIDKNKAKKKEKPIPTETEETPEPKETGKDNIPSEDPEKSTGDKKQVKLHVWDCGCKFIKSMTDPIDKNCPNDHPEAKIENVFIQDAPTDDE